MSACSAAKTLWQQSCHWFMPPPHRLLVHTVPVLAGCAISRLSGMCIEANPQQPAAAFLLQHQVQGRTLLPGAAMFESCYAAAHMLTGNAILLQRIAQRMRVSFCTSSGLTLHFAKGCRTGYAKSVLRAWAACRCAQELAAGFDYCHHTGSIDPAINSSWAAYSWHCFVQLLLPVGWFV